MTIDQIRSAVHARPFMPFTLYHEDGRRFLVDDPISIALTGKGGFVAVAGSGDSLPILEVSNLTQLVVSPLMPKHL